MPSTAGQNKIGILQNLQTLIDSISNFTDNVYISQVTKADKFPSVQIKLFEDNPIQETSNEEQHVLLVNIKVEDVKKTHHRETDKETVFTDFVELIGLIEDKLKANWYNTSYWNNLHVEKIVYKYGGYTWLNASMTVKIKEQW